MKKIVLIFLILVFLIPFLNADIVVFKTGDRKTGMVIESGSDPGYIIFISTAGEMKIPRSRISKITIESQDQSFLHIGRGYMGLKDYASAKENIERALKINPDNEEAKALLEQVQKEIKQEAARNKQQKSEKIDKNFEQVRELIKEQDFERALDLLKDIERSELSDSQKKEIKDVYFTLYYEWGLNSLDRLNPKAAAHYFERALTLKPKNQDVFNQLLSIWDKDPKMTVNVIAIYEQQYKVDPDDLEVNRKLADLYFRIRDFKSALPYLIKVHKKSKTRNPIVAERLRDSLGNLHTNAALDKKFELAAKYYREFLDSFPGEDPTPLYYYQYSQMRQNVADDDLEAHVKLGDFCKEHYLDEEAKSEYFHVLQRDAENEKALKGLTEYALKDLQEAELTFRNKDYDATLYLINKIVAQYIKLPDILTTAYELKERAEIELRREEKEKKDRALRLALRGDEYYAEAKMHISHLKSTERRSDFSVVSDKEEAKKFLRRALNVWEAALQIDPTLAQTDKQDLDTKISDARIRLINLTRVVPFPDTYSLRRQSLKKSEND